MLDYASTYFRQPDVVYDVLNIDCDASEEADGASRIVDAYGQFGRVYSFMAVHNVRNRAWAYRNVLSCLKEGG
ncbi:hypothetical protein HPB52_015206 [Rhipicephalus sanguineus]|uniref:Uncharacterized protein n=1 Tax=Rhipicephalus sanguineus TaxID=34632 RepID=A0A9D4PPC4_RHISA|nr:hypothetical protein HPB52_015206 [Rhipicephalus sanguineus]